MIDKMDKQTKVVLGAIAFLLVLFFWNNGSIFSTTTLISPEIQYYNNPIKADIITDLSSPSYQVYFNNNPVSVEPTISEGMYTFTLNDITTEGIARIVLSTENETVTKLIQVRKPYISMKTNLQASYDKGTEVTIEAQTYNPQQDILLVDAIDVDVAYPDSSHETLFMKNTNETTFSLDFKFKNQGGYVFKFYPRLGNYNTKEHTVIVQVTSKAFMNPIYYIWLGGIIIWIILFLIRFLGGRRR